MSEAIVSNSITWTPFGSIERTDVVNTGVAYTSYISGTIDVPSTVSSGDQYLFGVDSFISPKVVRIVNKTAQCINVVTTGEGATTLLTIAPQGVVEMSGNVSNSNAFGGNGFLLEATDTDGIGGTIDYLLLGEYYQLPD